ncbi:hypothetical protein [Mesorhizobium sp. B2-3-5]|uniref:hypothetical protein n=1 Tax=Mesorhizobium sp. B2-3-5 TaxID=2589958 RepID=UPI00112AA72F|nr:hypothetical protein [Mesorhizobium sp. B2-3-5]TPM21634.1 hypothetical protein FJ958_25995 [Mesorhizobium sp. B2-3-5]
MSASASYKATIAFIFHVISIAMIAVGVIISLCVIADNIFDLSWGYRWWSFLFCIAYLGVAIAINRSARYVRRMRG